MGPSVEELLRAAHQHLGRNEVAEAEAVCQRALAQRPNNPDGQMLAAAIAARGGRFDRAEYLLGRVLQRNPKAVQALYLLGGVQQRAGQPRKALRSLMRAMQFDFGLPPAASAFEFWRMLVDGIKGGAPLQAFAHREEEIAAFGAILEATGYFAEHAQHTCEGLAAVDMCTLPQTEVVDRLNVLLRLAAFNKSSAEGWNRKLFESAVLQWMKRALGADLFDAALALEVRVLNEFVAQTETEANFAACLGRWTEDMRNAGKRFASRFPTFSQPVPSQPPKIAFFVHVLSPLAHVRLLLDVLEGHAQLPEPIIQPLIVCLHRSTDASTDGRLAQLGIEIFEIARPGTGFVQAEDLGTLRKLVQDRSIDAAAWVSSALLMPFAFAMRVAPVQIWWAMKYHALEFPEIDGYLTGGGVAGGTRRIGAREWRAGPVAAEDWFGPELAPAAVKVRAGYSQHRVLCGCFGREEKLNSKPFLDSVAAILKAVPGAGFLWTGRERHPAVQASFEASGIADRCHFIGWVNTRLYAQVIDVFLDSFPFPCGYTLYESMAAGKPAVLYASAEAMETGARSLIEPLLDRSQGTGEEQARARSIFRPGGGDDYYLCASTSEEYSSLGARLGTDAAFRERAGAAARSFVETFMSDRARAARIYCEHLVAIVGEVAAKGAG